MRSKRRPTTRRDPFARERALDALALSRRQGMSLTRAARLTGTTRRTVLRHVGAGFRRDGRRWAPRRFDRIPREMTVLTDDGPIVLVIRDSRTASLVAEHANAVRHYLHTGDERRLDDLRRQTFRLRGETVVLVTEPDLIDELARGSELHYEVYRR
jgi:hypothetical protein